METQNVHERCQPLTSFHKTKSSRSCSVSFRISLACQAAKHLNSPFGLKDLIVCPFCDPKANATIETHLHMPASASNGRCWPFNPFMPMQCRTLHHNVPRTRISDPTAQQAKLQRSNAHANTKPWSLTIAKTAKDQMVRQEPKATSQMA